MSALLRITILCDRDGCDRRLDTDTHRLDAAYREAEAAGWKTGGERGGDFCPTCREKGTVKR